MSETEPTIRTPLSREALGALTDRFHDDFGNYNRLRGELQGVRGRSGVWETDYVLERYVEATDGMVGRLDGSIHERAISDPDNSELSQEKPDVVVWLDKSARPVSWFVDGFWEQFADPEVEKPDYEFLNIDRVNWFVNMGHSRIDAETRLGPNDFDIEKVPDETIARLRALFVVGELSEDNWQEEVWKLPTRLDGKNVLIVDEVKNKGGTLAIATQVLKRAIPELTVSGDYFWSAGLYSINKMSADPADMQMESAPVWYDAKDSMGRGIGEVSKVYWSHEYETHPTQDNLKKKLGWQAISAPHFNPRNFHLKNDPLATKLQQDIAYLSYAVGDGRVLRRPDQDRGTDESIKIINDQGISVREYAQYRTHISEKNKPR